jgi:hypothetical protein
MYKSARILGYENGLTAQEMNQLMYNQGFLKGEPCNYELTEKAYKYAKQMEYHRGTGGYPSYNRTWIEKTYDDSIINELDLSIEEIIKAKDQVKLRRIEQLKIRMEQRAEADRKFLEANNKIIENQSQNKFELPVGVKAVLISGAIIAIGYGIYKIPAVNNWIHNKFVPFFKKGDKLYKNMICPKCGKNLLLKDDTWQCSECDFKISDKRIKNGEIFCCCADCDTLLNEQESYSASDGIWTCSKCGCVNEVPQDINNNL